MALKHSHSLKQCYWLGICMQHIVFSRYFYSWRTVTHSNKLFKMIAEGLVLETTVGKTIKAPEIYIAFNGYLVSSQFSFLH